MSPILSAILPVATIIALGLWCRRAHFPGQAFWPLAEKLTYFILLPSLFFKSVAVADFSDAASVFRLVAALSLAMVITSLMAFLLWPLVGKTTDGASFASFFQGSIRFNNYVGLPIIYSLYGNQGVATYAIMMALSIPLSNLFTVLVMARYAAHTPLPPKRLLAVVLKNPLIMASFLGIGWNLTGLSLGYAQGVIDILANASLALGLLSVGHGLEWHAIRGAKTRLAGVITLKLIINPMAVSATCILFGITGQTYAIALIYSCLPVAASSYVMAREFQANLSFMAAIIAATTLASGVALLVVLTVIQAGSLPMLQL